MIRQQPYKRAVIVVDVDGVVADWFHSASHIMKMMYGVPRFPISNYGATTWGFGCAGLTKEQEDKFWDWLHSSEDRFWESEREMEPGCVARFYNQSIEDATWYWCTTRDDQKNGTAQEQTVQFLRNNCFYDPCVVVSDRKEDFCYSVHADMFIDDKFSNCKKVKEKNPDCRVIFLLMPYQLEFVEEAKAMGMVVCEDLDTVYREIAAFKANFGKP